MWQCRVASSLGDGFAGTVESAWGTLPYEKEHAPTVFFGMYGLPDFYALWRHKGERAILWAGSDILHFKNGYWLTDGGSIRLPVEPIARWIQENCMSYVENQAEYDELAKLGITSIIVPSFLGDVRDYPLSYTPSETPKVYASVSSNNFDYYRWHEIDAIARENPKIEFHLYGNTIPFETQNRNVIVHGRVSQEEMNKEIMKMQGAIRLLPHDGCSEVVAKAFLWGQYVISAIPYRDKGYQYSIDPKDIRIITLMKFPNIQGRNWFIKSVNKYPWNAK